MAKTMQINSCTCFFVKSFVTQTNQMKIKHLNNPYIMGVFRENITDIIHISNAKMFSSETCISCSNNEI